MLRKFYILKLFLFFKIWFFLEIALSIITSAAIKIIIMWIMLYMFWYLRGKTALICEFFQKETSEKLVLEELYRAGKGVYLDKKYI